MVVEVSRGDGPVVLGFPHIGLDLPDEIRAGLNRRGQGLDDTDWHVGRLYDGLLTAATAVTSVRARVHRYVIDANRDPQGKSLYPGQATTTLCPVTDFDNNPIYRDGCAPDAAEVRRRTELYHRPYHAALAAELRRVHRAFGHVVLLDCHSIRSRIPHLFAGRLPDFNIGTNDATTCAAGLASAFIGVCAGAAGYSHVVNGRFKGGWTVRHYGRPGEGVHAIQLELAQSTYMQEHAPWTYRSDKAGRLRVHLKKLLETLSDWRP